MAHVGGRADLPVPVGFFVVGAALAVVVSFVMVSSAWTEPRLQGPYRRTTSGSHWVGRISALAAIAGGVGLVLVVVNGLVDGTASTRSIGVVLVWIVFWLVVPFGSLLVGGIWQVANPYRRIVERLSAGVREKPDRRNTLGVWPAVVLFLGFVWFELVYPSNTLPQQLAIAAVVYGVYLVGLSRLLGPQSALRSGDAFEVYTGIISRMSTIELQAHGRAERRRWLAALPSLPLERGTTAFIIAMIGTVSYDGMSGAGWWIDLVGDLRREMWFETTALIGTVVAIGLLYLAASFAAKRLAGSERTVTEIARSFAHTLVPIAFAYAFAHYFTLVVFEGQQLIHNASDPFGRGWDLFGTADWRILFTSSQLWVWYIQVAVIILGHVGGVIFAHDRALAEFGSEVAVRTQYAMLVLMVALTSLGLFILAG